MPKWRKYPARSRLGVLCMLVLCWLLSACTREYNYSVAVPYLPIRFDPRFNRINVNHYILQQMYWPLITKSNDGRGVVNSEFLDPGRSVALAEDFSQFRLCLKPNLRYTDGSLLDAQDLHSTLEILHSKREQLSPIMSLDVEGSCVRITMERGDAYYLEKLTSIDTTVLKRGTEGDALPVGRGPYRIVDRDDDQLRLEWAGFGPSPDFSSITFVKVDGVEDALSRGLTDVNLLYWDRLPPEDSQGRVRLNRDVLRTYSLIVAIPNDAPLRRCIGACLDAQAFARVALPFEPVRTAGYLPRGLPGSDADLEDLRGLPPGCSCAASNRLVEYHNPIPERQTSIAEYLGRSPLPARIEVRAQPWPEFLDAIRSHTSMLYTIGMDTANSQVEPLDEAAIFFEAFYGARRCIEENLDDVEALTRAALREPDSSKKQAFYREAHRALLRSGYVVPLGQHPSSLSYPRGIRHVEFADPYIGYPRIELTRRR